MAMMWTIHQPILKNLKGSGKFMALTSLALPDHVANVKHQRYAYDVDYPPAYP